MPHTIRPGDVLAGRYRLVDLLSESGDGRFWRAHDRVLERHVALHVISAADPRAEGLLEAARRSATVHDQRLLRVLDAEQRDGICYVVNEWGTGTSLDIMLANNGPLPPRHAAWMVAEVADTVAVAHARGVAHGRLVPENLLLDRGGAVRVIGFAVDAALHGLPADRTQVDVADLAGLLYAALTGRWPGASTSQVARAPQAHGRVLRPRQVRAGIPRPLDDLCDEVLNPYSPARHRDLRDLTSARGIEAYLGEFVGDPTGLPESLAASNPGRGNETVVLPSVPDIRPRDSSTEEPEATTVVPLPADDGPPPPPPASASVELPTQAGLPIFDDEHDDVSWLSARSEPAAPPPPFEEPPERPLFAPEPTDGQPVRRPRASAVDAADPVHSGTGGTGDYWPWDTGRGTGTGLNPVADDEEVPGRSTFRLGLAVLAGLLLLVAIVVAYNLGRGKTPLGAEPDDATPGPTTSASPGAVEPTPINGLVAVDFDPQGDPPEENPEDAPLAVDGDRATSWSTQTYDQDLGPGGLKSGVGLTVDLGSRTSVSQVDLSLVGAGTGLSLFVTDTAPSAVRGLDPVATLDDAGAQARVSLDEPASGRFLTVWLTTLPGTDDGRFRGGIAEVGVRG